MADFSARRMVMVDSQVRPSDVTKFPIIDAMLSIPREAFVPDAQAEAAYVGEHIPLGPGRVILDPRTFAKILDALDIQPDDMVLDLGCGLGYSAAVLARLGDAVVAVEEDEALAAQAQQTLSAHGFDNAAVLAGPLSAGAAKHGPYDVILIEGAVEEVPDAILAQLAEGGRIAAIFAEGRLGTVRTGLRQGGRVTWRFAFNAAAPVLPGFARARGFVL